MRMVNIFKQHLLMICTNSKWKPGQMGKSKAEMMKMIINDFDKYNRILTIAHELVEYVGMVMTISKN